MMYLHMGASFMTELIASLHDAYGQLTNTAARLLSLRSFRSG